jgi:hypothetical protein
MRSEELKQHICITAGVECPPWLGQIASRGLLADILALVSSGVMLISSDGPELSPIVAANIPPHYVQRAIDMIRFLKHQ